MTSISSFKLDVPDNCLFKVLGIYESYIPPQTDDYPYNFIELADNKQSPRNLVRLNIDKTSRLHVVSSHSNGTKDGNDYKFTIPTRPFSKDQSSRFIKFIYGLSKNIWNVNKIQKNSLDFIAVALSPAGPGGKVDLYKLINARGWCLDVFDSKSQLIVDCIDHAPNKPKHVSTVTIEKH